MIVVLLVFLVPMYEVTLHYSLYQCLDVRSYYAYSYTYLQKTIPSALLKHVL